MRTKTLWILLVMTLTLALACGPGEKPVSQTDQGQRQQRSTMSTLDTPAATSQAEVPAAVPAPTPTPALEAPIATTIVVRPGGIFDNLQSSATTEQPKPLPQVTAAPAPPQEQELTTAAPQAMEDSGHIEYMLRLLALDHAYEFWFVDLESIAADPELAPLLQNLVDTWNVWNKDSSEEFGLTLQDAAFAVSLPGQAVFFGGIADVEGLRETLVSKGYEREEVQGVGYWTNPSGEGSSLMFLAHNVVLVPGTTSFLEDAGCFISDDSCWRDGEWQRYRNEMDSALDIGSMDDLVSEIRSSLLFHFDGFDSQQYTFAKAGTTGGLTVKAIQAFPDEDTQNLAEAMADETSRQKFAEFMAYRFAIGSTQDCIDADLDWSGNPKIIATGVCPAESIEFGSANYFLSLR